jgi:hypothetical protein
MVSKATNQTVFQIRNCVKKFQFLCQIFGEALKKFQLTASAIGSVYAG